MKLFILLYFSCGVSGPLSSQILLSAPQSRKAHVIYLDEVDEILSAIDKLSLPDLKSSQQSECHTCWYTIEIDETGKAQSVLVKQSCGDLIDSSVVESIKSSTFKQIRDVNGESAIYSFSLPVYFRNGVLTTPLRHQNIIEQYDNLRREAGVIPHSESVEGPREDPPRPIGGFNALKQNLRLPGSAKNDSLGKATLTVFVDERGIVGPYRALLNGNPLDTKTISAATKNIIKAFYQAVKSVKWKPATFYGLPCPAWVALPIIFIRN